MAIYKTHVIQKPETLQDIATQQLGDTSRWTELVDLNDLVYPYIVDTDIEKNKDIEHLVTWGDRLKLPAENSISDMDYYQYSQNEVREIYDTAMGMDIGLNIDEVDARLGSKDSLAYLQADSSGKDIKVVKGLKNLKQSLELRLLTRYGTLAYHPNYGSHLLDMIGDKLNEDLVSRLKIEILRTVKTDKRVDSVKIDYWNVPDGKTFYCVLLIKPNDIDSEFNLYISLANTGKMRFD